MTDTQKKKLALIGTIFVAVILIGLMFIIYMNPDTTKGDLTAGQKIKDFFNDTVQTTSSYFAK